MHGMKLSTEFNPAENRSKQAAKLNLLADRVDEIGLAVDTLEANFAALPAAQATSPVAHGDPGDLTVYFENALL